MSIADINDISKGYRNICYRNGKDNEGEIVLFGWDKDGKRDTFVFPFNPSASYEVKEETEHKTIYDTYVNKKVFKNSWDRKKWLDAASDGINVVEAFRPEQEFLIENFGKYAFDDSFNNLPLRIHFLDIEIAIGNSGFIGNHKIKIRKKNKK